MTSHLKKYIIFLLCTALLHAALFSPAMLIAEQAIPVHEAHETMQSTENHEQSAVANLCAEVLTKEEAKADRSAKKEKTTEKPTLVESWRKVVTLRWKELGKADAWNIGAPVASIAALGLLAYSYWPKNIIPNNVHNNPDDNNPDGRIHIPPLIPTNDHVGDNTHVLNSANRLTSDLNTTIHPPRLPDTNDLSSSSSNEDSSSSTDATSSSDSSSNSNSFDFNSSSDDSSDDSSSSSSDLDTSNPDSSSDSDTDENFERFLHAIANHPNGLRILNVIANITALDSSNDNDGNNEAMFWALNFATNNLNADASNSSSSSDDDSISTDTTSSSDNSSSSSSSDISDSDSSHEDNSIAQENHELIPLTQEQRKNIACFYDNEVLINDIQHKIALNMVADFLIKPKTLAGHTEMVTSVAIAGDKVVTGSHDKTAKIWDINTGQLLHTLAGHTENVIPVAIAGDKVVTASWDNTAKIWDINTGQLLHTLAGHTEAIRSVAVADDKVVTASWDNTAKIWDIDTGLLRHTLERHTRKVHRIAVTSDKVVTGSSDGTANIWNINTGELLHTFKRNEGFSSVAINGNKVIESHDNTANILDIDTGLLQHTLQGHTAWISSIATSDNKVITGSHDKTAKIWDTNTGQLLHTLWHTAEVQSIAISGNTVVTRSFPKTAKIWDINTGQLLHTLAGHTGQNTLAGYNTGQIWSVAVAGDKVATASRDKTAKIWQLYIDFNAPEFTDPEHALFWIKHNLLPMQANLIARAHTATQAEETFEINNNTDDAHIWITFPNHVRTYLCERLNIELTSKKECSLCLDTKNIKEFHIMNGCNGPSGCKSSFCKECLLGHITTHLDQGSTLNLTCPNVQCGKKIDPSDVQAITQNNKDLYDRFDKITLKEYLASNPHIKHCQTPDCTFSFILEKGVERQKITCSCKRKYCSHCLFNHSFKITCDQAKADRELAQDPNKAQQATAKWIAENTKPCPQCNTSIQKNMGCNHMRCKKCKHQFCWTCSATWGTTECGINGCAVLNIQTGINF